MALSINAVSYLILRLPELLNPPGLENGSALIFRLILPFVAEYAYIPVFISSYSDKHTNSYLKIGA
jgi:hypothetical protein